jgi:hypothetical protein
MLGRIILAALLLMGALYLSGGHDYYHLADGPAPTFSFPTDPPTAPTVAPTPAPTVRPRHTAAPTIDTGCLDVDCYEPCDELAGTCDDIDAGYY